MAGPRNDSSPLRLTIPPPVAQALHEDDKPKKRVEWKRILGRGNSHGQPGNRTAGSDSDQDLPAKKPEKWSMGILNDRETDEVPGSILLLSKVSEYNEPLGLRNAPARTSASSLPSPYPPSVTSSFRRRRTVPDKKRTADGKFVLEPQPDDSLNDPLNWAVWRRDLALLSLGFYCMLGGGMTPILAAGFNQVSQDFGVTVPQVALTTGLYMMGLGLGSVILSPTAILFGKRPVYLMAAICFILSSVWCALAPNFANLIVARIFMGLAVSSVECLPSASVAEIYFLHEKAYRLGIYTLLLLGGKNLVPLVSAAIIQRLRWRWVFWVVAIVVGFGLILLFFFVPETFWDRTPRRHRRSMFARSSLSIFRARSETPGPRQVDPQVDMTTSEANPASTVEKQREKKHAHFESDRDNIENEKSTESHNIAPDQPVPIPAGDMSAVRERERSPVATRDHYKPDSDTDYFTSRQLSPNDLEAVRSPSIASYVPQTPGEGPIAPNAYTNSLLQKPPKTFIESLQPFSGRLSQDNWFRVAARPFVLFLYPSILWSSLVYALSIGWLIVLSESVSTIYQNRSTYNFTALQAGLVYISPFVGGIIGTVVAGKVSDIMVRALSRRNGGVYEPEFRLFMAIPIALTTTIGLMGYGWSAQERDLWIVPTIFFGLISFGCSLGSTTSITFAIDSYRQYAGEALVTLNFSKNILHGLVFSLFFNHWLEAKGSKSTFVAIGGIQLGCLLTTIPMYIYGKRARMWTVRKNLMEKL